MNDDKGNTVYDEKGLPGYLYPFFWEYDPGKIHIMKHADFIIGRIMERGTWTSMRWLQKTYPRERLISFLEKKGRRRLPPRELNYWALISGIPPEKRKKWIKEAREKPHVWGNRHER